jgi:predicted acetyltransferase
MKSIQRHLIKIANERNFKIVRKSFMMHRVITVSRILNRRFNPKKKERESTDIFKISEVIKTANNKYYAM